MFWGLIINHDAGKTEEFNEYSFSVLEKGEDNVPVLHEGDKVLSSLLVMEKDVNRETKGNSRRLQ